MAGGGPRPRPGAAGARPGARLVSVVARGVAAADPLSDGFAVTVDDGSGPLRVVATAMSGIVPSDLPLQGWFRLSGGLGRRDSSGTGAQGYRLYPRSPLDVVAMTDPP